MLMQGKSEKKGATLNVEIWWQVLLTCLRRLIIQEKSFLFLFYLQRHLLPAFKDIPDPFSGITYLNLKDIRVMNFETRVGVAIFLPGVKFLNWVQPNATVKHKDYRVIYHHVYHDA